MITLSERGDGKAETSGRCRVKSKQTRRLLSVITKTERTTVSKHLTFVMFWLDARYVFISQVATTIFSI